MFAATSAATNVTPSKRDHCAAFPSWVIMWRGGMSMNYVCESAGFVQHHHYYTNTLSQFYSIFLYIWSQFMQQEKEKKSVEHTGCHHTQAFIYRLSTERDWKTAPSIADMWHLSYKPFVYLSAFGLEFVCQL